MRASANLFAGIPLSWHNPGRIHLIILRKNDSRHGSPVLACSSEGTAAANRPLSPTCVWNQTQTKTTCEPLPRNVIAKVEMSTNPYLAFSALLMAGIDGIQNPSAGLFFEVCRFPRQSCHHASVPVAVAGPGMISVPLFVRICHDGHSRPYPYDRDNCYAAGTGEPL